VGGGVWGGGGWVSFGWVCWFCFCCGVFFLAGVFGGGVVGFMGCFLGFWAVFFCFFFVGVVFYGGFVFRWCFGGGGFLVLVGTGWWGGRVFCDVLVVTVVRVFGGFGRGFCGVVGGVFFWRFFWGGFLRVLGGWFCEGFCLGVVFIFFFFVFGGWSCEVKTEMGGHGLGLSGRGCEVVGAKQ